MVGRGRQAFGSVGRWRKTFGLAKRGRTTTFDTGRRIHVCGGVVKEGEAEGTPRREDKTRGSVGRGGQAHGRAWRGGQACDIAGTEGTGHGDGGGVAHAYVSDTNG